MTSVRDRLLAWYGKQARDLPWRHTRDPYAVWVSEVMLQQTRVETVIPYYERFLARFPSAEALAEADEDTVLAHWSGLGYYRRARLLHRGVREVVSEYGGEVPADPVSRRGLPGVGRYTAGAIGSIAFDREEPVVDGNVSRVLARLCGIRTPLGTAETTARLWKEAGRLVVGPRPGDFNQALMELGAMVCTPTSPRCEDCPLHHACAARASGATNALPVKAARKAPKSVALSAVVATRGAGRSRRAWLLKSEEPLFGGLWGLPMSKRGPRQALLDAGLSARLSSDSTGIVEHVLTHRRLAIDVYTATGVSGAPSSQGRLFSEEELDRVGVSRLTRKVLAAAQRD